MIFVLGCILIGVSAVLLAGASLFYPTFLIACSALKKPSSRSGIINKLPDSVSCITIVRNGQELVECKLQNWLEMLPENVEAEVLLVSDGSTDATVKNAVAITDPRVRLVVHSDHIGKNAAINAIIPECRGNILIFSDADALLAEQALTHLLRPFEDENIGGVCGLRRLGDDSGSLRAPQQTYINYDSWLKTLESSVGSIASNDGKLYAIRRDLFVPLDPAATDDMFNALSVLSAGFRMAFARKALAFIKTPSRSIAHELRRRRRVTARSLRGIFGHAHLLNPMRYGQIALSLICNKVIRRFMPVLACLGFVGIIFITAGTIYAETIWTLMIVGLATVFAYAKTGARWPLPPLVRKNADRMIYFLIGNLGMLLGCWDTLVGKHYDRWDPVKSDPSTSTGH